MNINPIKLNGNWDEGWALDKHILNSVPIGEDIYGYMRFDNTYSEIGKLVYYFKNRGKYDNLGEIADYAVAFLDTWDKLKEVDVILPVPFSKIRNYQPSTEIALAISEHYQIAFADNILRKTDSNQSKDMNIVDKNLRGTIIADKKANKPHTILLIDDLYSTGATLNECVRVLREDPKLNRIYVLTMTKTKKG